jgi:hypothetical protein
MAKRQTAVVRWDGNLYAVKCRVKSLLIWSAWRSVRDANGGFAWTKKEAQKRSDAALNNGVIPAIWHQKGYLPNPYFLPIWSRDEESEEP